MLPEAAGEPPLTLGLLPEFLVLRTEGYPETEPCNPAGVQGPEAPWEGERLGPAHGAWSCWPGGTGASSPACLVPGAWACGSGRLSTRFPKGWAECPGDNLGISQAFRSPTAIPLLALGVFVAF